MRKWALIEQGTLSIGNFGLALVMARTMDKTEWGTYSLGYALLLLVQGFHRAYFSLPFVTMTPDRETLAVTYRHWGKFQFQLLAGAVFLLLAASYAWNMFSSNAWIAESMVIAAILVPGVFIHEYVRRLLIQDGGIKLCSQASIIFLLLLIILGTGLITQELGSAPIWAASVSGCFVMAALYGWARWDRPPLSLDENRRSQLPSVMHFGKWAALGHLAYAGYNTGVQIILSLIAGPVAMGQFAAVRNLIQPINTIVGAIDSVDKPKATRAYAAGGFGEMFLVLRNTLGALLVAGGAYLLLCAYMGGSIIDALYAGRYGQPWSEVWLWCGVALAMMLTQPTESGLYVAQRPDALFANRLVSAAVGLGVALLLVPDMGVVGALWALMAGWFISALLAVWQLRRLALAAQGCK